MHLQILLVAMHDALKSDPHEFVGFCREVPKFARILIPTWRRILYNKRAKYLDEGSKSMHMVE